MNYVNEHMLVSAENARLKAALKEAIEIIENTDWDDVGYDEEKIDEFKKLVADPEDDDPYMICCSCGGSGQGPTDQHRCYTCKGEGEILKPAI